MKSLFILCTISLLSLSLTACSNNSADPTTPDFAATCAASGGEWVRGGTLGFYGCLKPAQDAGKVCSDSKECQHDCLTSSRSSPREGEAATGECQANNSYTGCRTEVRKGIALPKFCITI